MPSCTQDIKTTSCSLTLNAAAIGISPFPGGCPAPLPALQSRYVNSKTKTKSRSTVSLLQAPGLRPSQSQGAINESYLLI